MAINGCLELWSEFFSFVRVKIRGRGLGNMWRCQLVGVSSVLVLCIGKGWGLGLRLRVKGLWNEIGIGRGRK